MPDHGNCPAEGHFRPITEFLSYLPASESPLSAETVLIRCEDGLWLYDVGSSDESAAAIQALRGKRQVVLSHFHADHAGNLGRITFDALYAGPFACKRFGMGEAVSREMFFPDGVRLFPLPSSHAKGCVGLCYQEYAFLGDAAYSMQKDGRVAYNAGQLQALIRTMNDLPARVFYLSHRMPERFSKEALLSFLQKIYAQRSKDSPYIFPDDEV